MKNLILIFIFLTSFLFANAQKISKSAHIKMEVTDVSSQDESMKPFTQMFLGTKSEYYFHDHKTLMIQNMMGGMISSSTLIDQTSNQMEMLIDLAGNKNYFETDKDQMDSKNLDKSKPSITYDKNDKKNILGYQCYKAVMQTQEGLVMKFFVTDDIEIDAQGIQGLKDVELNGFPLEMTTETNGLTLTYTATEINENFDKKVFNLDKSGFKKITLEEFNQMIGQMGGGLGF